MKKGFTLIELLAVIVILAIIALIVTPIVMNVIENARKGASERTAENYIDAVELAIASKRLEGTIISDGTYTLVELESEDKLGTIEVNGNKPTSGRVKIENGTVVTTKDTTMTVGDYTVSYDEEEKIVATKSKVVYRRDSKEVKIRDEISTFTYAEDPKDLGNYYLKHTIEDNKVTESYACAILIIEGNDQEVCLRGGVDTDGNSYFNENYSILEDIYAKVSSCRLGVNGAFCNDGYVNLDSISSGFVNARDDYGNCQVNNEGSSSCGSN